MAQPKETPGPRERILDAARRLFYVQGYLATGINQIIAEAGVAKASFYQHFRSKEALALAFLERRHDFWFAWLKGVVEAQPDPLRRIEALFDFLEQWLRVENYRGCAFINMAAEFPDADNPIRGYISIHKTELRDYLRGLVAAARPGFDPGRLSRLADGLFVVFEGAIAESSALGRAWPVQAAREAAGMLLEAG